MSRLNSFSLLLCLSMAFACGDDDGVTPADLGPDPVDAAGLDLGTMTEDDAGPDGCGEGLQDVDEDGTCLPSCDSTADPLDCGEGGTCVESTDTGERACECDSGFVLEGDICAFDYPPLDGLDVWLDASDRRSLALDDSDRVTAWANLRSGSEEVVQTVVSARPARIADERNGRSVIRFDGGDQLLMNSYTGLSGADYEIIVAANPVGGAPIALVGAVEGTSDWAVMLDQHQGNDFRILHRQPAGGVDQTAAVANRDGSVGPGWVAASLQSSGAIDTLAIWASDGADEAMAIETTDRGEVGNDMSLRIGRTSLGFMAGDIYEVLIYTRRLDVAERDAVKAYLEAKWSL